MAWFRRHRELAAGIVLGIVLGVVVVALFVFVFSEQAVDEPQIDHGGAVTTTAPSSTAPKTTP
jgi:Mg/Co/Ni transporter MgtE